MTAKSYLTASVSAQTAHDLVATIAAEAQKAERLVSISVCDNAGVEKAFLRMDGAPLLTIKWARDKAYTAAGFGLPTDAWHPMIKDDPPLAAGVPHGERVVIFGGGSPLLIDGQLVGGVGVSGGHYTEDMAIVSAGMAAMGFAKP